MHLETKQKKCFYPEAPLASPDLAGPAAPSFLPPFPDGIFLVLSSDGMSMSSALSAIFLAFGASAFAFKLKPVALFVALLLALSEALLFALLLLDALPDFNSKDISGGGGASRSVGRTSFG